MFINQEEIELSDVFLKNGYIIKDIVNRTSLDIVKSKLITACNKSNLYPPNINDECILSLSHDHIPIKELNSFRLFIINELSKDKDLRSHYYDIFKYYTDLIIGNELAMQKKLNLSIQMPNDKSSLLSIHADTWSGDSPFEAVCWLPMVDCTRSMCMFILPAFNYHEFNNVYKKIKTKNSDTLFDALKDKLHWIEIKYGQILIFNQNLPHGNIINEEKFTRWSFNCRFKSVFTPYRDKKIGEFFEPITLKPMSKIGINYVYPDEESG